MALEFERFMCYEWWAAMWRSIEDRKMKRRYLVAGLGMWALFVTLVVLSD